MSFPIKSWMLLVAALLLQLLLMAYQLRQHGDVPLFRFGTNALVTPVQKGLNATIDAAGAVWYGYLDLRGAREESEQLTEEKNQLRMEVLSLRQEAAAGRRLRSFFDLGIEIPGEAVVARVISISASETSKMIVINKGRNDGIEADSAVIVPDGVVGKVLYVYPSSAQVLLITDPFSGVAGMLEVSRTHGIVKGQNTALCSMDYVPAGLAIAAEERVLTSGVDTIFPKGLPIGVVERSLPGGAFQQITLRPAASLSSLEEVIVFRKTAVESTNEELAANEEMGEEIGEEIEEDMEEMTSSQQVPVPAAVSGDVSAAVEASGDMPPEPESIAAPITVPTAPDPAPIAAPNTAPIAEPATTGPEETPSTGQTPADDLDDADDLPGRPPATTPVFENSPIESP